MQQRNKFDQESLVKIGKGALIAGGAVAILYILESLTAIDFGNATPVVVGILSIIINAIKEYRKETQQPLTGN